MRWVAAPTVRWLRTPWQSCALTRRILTVGVVLALAGCGKYGPPLRTPEKSAAPVAATPSAEATADEDRKESKP